AASMKMQSDRASAVRVIGVLSVTRFVGEPAMFALSRRPSSICLSTNFSKPTEVQRRMNGARAKRDDMVFGSLRQIGQRAIPRHRQTRSPGSSQSKQGVNRQFERRRAVTTLR